MSNSNSPIIPDLLKKSYIMGAEEDQGIKRANAHTHKRYLRQHHLGKFKKKQAK